MQRANAIGGLLSILTGIVWLMVGVAGWSIWVGVVVSMVVGGYWAFGRALVAGPAAVPDGRARERNRNRNRGRI